MKYKILLISILVLHVIFGILVGWISDFNQIKEFYFANIHYFYWLFGSIVSVTFTSYFWSVEVYKKNNLIEQNYNDFSHANSKVYELKKKIRTYREKIKWIDEAEQKRQKELIKVLQKEISNLKSKR